MQMLQTPPVLDQIRREPIEQFRIRRTRAVQTKVTRCFDDSGAEVKLPDAIRDDAGGQWVCGINYPFRQRKTPLSLWHVRLKLVRPEINRCRRDDLFLFLQSLTAMESMRRTRLL